MSITCTCPVPTSTTEIGALSCPVNFGQIQRLVFWRTGQEIADVATAILAATWTALFAAADDTHATFTPLIDNPVVEPGGEMTLGSGNEVRNGIPYNVGNEPTVCTFTLNRFSSTIIRVLKEYRCEDLDVIFVSEDGYFGHTLDGVKVQGFPIHSLTILDRKIGGFNAFDEHLLKFSLAEDWSDYFTITDPTANFNPLTDW